MRLVFSKRFVREYGKLTPTLQSQVDKALELLEENPQHPSLRTHKRKDDNTVWQTRVTRSYRMLFEMEAGVITVFSVMPHKK